MMRSPVWAFGLMLLLFSASAPAARLLGMDTDTLIPGVELVGNTFVSLIGYQAKGYGLIPIY